MSALFRFALRLFPRPLLIRVSQWLYPLLDLWYRGKGFTDPINGKSYRKFLPYGYHGGVRVAKIVAKACTSPWGNIRIFLVPFFD